MIDEELKKIMMECFCAGVVHERKYSPLGYTNEPEEMAQEWIDEIGEVFEEYYTEGDLSEKTARRNHRIAHGNDDFR